METPMSKLKDLFNSLNELLIDSQICNKVELSKSPEKYYRYNHKKGVESDFMRIYQFKTNIDLSFAFAFNYENGLDEVNITTKKDKEITNIVFNFETFKPKFKQFINSLKTLKTLNLLNSDNIISLLTKTFEFKEPLKSEKELVDELKEKINSKLEKLEELKTKEKELDNKFYDIKYKIDDEVSILRKQIEKKYDFDSIKEQRTQINNSRRNYTTKLNSEIDIEIKRVVDEMHGGSVIVNKLKKHFNNL
jgi:vacuolar-type H+-ATPase subunit I/STV1